MKKTVLDMPEQVADLRLQAASTTLWSFLRGEAPARLQKDIKDLSLQLRTNGRLFLGHALVARILASTPFDGATLWDAVDAYSRLSLGLERVLTVCIAEVLIAVFQPSEIGVWMGKGVALERTGLSLDDDGLLGLRNTSLRITKEGVIAGPHWLLYDMEVPGSFVSGGFIGDLLDTVKSNEVQAHRFSVAIAADVLLSSDYWRETITKAYIYGPKGLSLQNINAADFPKDPTGTVTVHQRLEGTEFDDLFPIDRVEIMWSRRDANKTVQIEELVPPPTDSLVSTKYIHGRWSPAADSFEHYDGAVKSYTRFAYADRLRTDMKKFKSKSAMYRKVFRIDGRIPLEAWCTLTTKFFDPDELIVEYLGGPADA
jgi:hypothetical protein